MPRANLKRAQNRVSELLNHVVERLQAERELDSSHIEAHLESAKLRRQGLDEEFKNIETYIANAQEAMTQSFTSLRNGLGHIFHELMAAEDRNISSLQGHADDINNDAEPALVEAEPAAIPMIAHSRRKA